MESNQATIIQHLQVAAQSPWTYAVILSLGFLYLASFLYSANGWRLRRLINIASLCATAGAIGWFTTTGGTPNRSQVASVDPTQAGSKSRATLPRHEPPNIALTGSEQALRNLRSWRNEQFGSSESGNFFNRWIDGRLARRQRRYAALPSSLGYDQWKQGYALLSSHRNEEALSSFRAAREYFSERLRLQPDNENRYGAALALEGMGLSARRHGRHEEAVRQLSEARTELQAIDEPTAKRAAAAVALSLADVQNERNESEAARQLYHDAIAAYENLQDTISTTWRRATGHAYLRYGRFETMQAQHNAASDALNNAGRHFSAAHASDENVLVFLAQAELDLAKGRFDEARRRIETARAANKALQRWDIEISSMLLIGRVQLAEGNLDQAAVSVDAARLVLGGLGDDIEIRSRLAIANLAAAEIQFRRGRSETARQHFEEVLVSHRSMFDHRGEAEAFGRLAQFEAKWGGRNQAVAAYNLAFALHRRLGDLRSLALLESDARHFCGVQTPAGRAAAVARFCRGREISSTAPLPPSSATDEKAGPSRPAGGSR